MGQKLNWGAALGSLAESLRTYAMMEAQKQQRALDDKARKDEIKGNQDFQIGRDATNRAAGLEDRLRLMDEQRGPQLGSVPMADTNWEPTAGAGPLRGLPRVNVQNLPVYRQDLEGRGSILGQRLAQMNGWGENKPQEQLYPFTTGGQTVQLPADQYATAALRRELDNGPGTGGGNPILDFARVQAQTKAFLGNNLRTAERLGVDDDIVLLADSLQREGVPLPEAIAKAAAQWLPPPNEAAISGASNDLRPYMPGKVSAGDKTIDNAVTIGAKPAVKRPGWFNDSKADPGSVVPYDEALTSPEYEGWRKDIAAIMKKRELTPTDVSTISDRWGLTEKQFYALLALSNQIQTGPLPDPEDPNDPRNFRRDGGRK